MRQLAAGFVLLAIGCASAQQDEPVTAPVTAAAPDPRIAEMQSSMTELLERMDVLNDRIARLEESASRAAAPASIPASTEPAATHREPVPQDALAGANAADAYRQAIVLFGRGKHAEARRGFQDVFDAAPSGDLADNALFWIGETYYATGDYANATRYYNRVVNEFPAENKAPDALFKIALAQEKTGDLALARKTLQQVIDRYPYSSTSSSAKAEMQRIRY